ncbi:MAG TPA: CHAT domain-containing tetratricopeptide repeat protein [Candidatus Eisenbacteria bacterium]|nr:CHAT domain-containing tetratricopeptide repeat protein [Candidatus Eisenbacteria bacterium]
MKARAKLREAEAGNGSESLEVAELLDQLVEALRRQGKAGAPEALEACRRAVAIKERLVGPDDPRYAASLFQWGYLQYVNQDYAGARRLFERTLSIQEAALGPNDAAIGATLVLLSAAMADAGETAAAQPFAERSLAIRTAALGADSPEVAESLNALAALKLKLGDFSGAMALQEMALGTWQKARHSDQVATALHNLAATLYLMGDYGGALSFERRALDLRIKALGPNHEYVADALSGVGLDLAALGRLSEARNYLRRAMAIQTKRFGANSGEVGWSLGRLGMVDLQARDYRTAKPTLGRATELLRRALGEEHQDFAEALAALATATAALGDADSAREMYERALRVQERILGPDHPDVGLMLTQYARLLAATGDDSLAVETALRGEETSREHLRLTSRSLSERQALAYAASRPAGGRVALSILAESPRASASLVSRVWDSLIRARMLVLDEMASRHRMATGSGDPETKRLAEELAEARRLLANLLVAGPRGDPPEHYRAAVERSRAAAELAERRLAESSAAFRRDQSRDRIGLREVVASLPPRTALVAYATAGDSANRSVIAFVYSCDDSVPECVRLGRASTIRTRISRWLSDVTHDGRVAPEPSSAAESLSRASGFLLRRLIWDPVAPLLHTATRVFVVPDGMIDLVNFAALPAGRDRYLVEAGLVFHYLSSERDLVPTSGPTGKGSGLLVLGDPSFGRGPARRPESESGCDLFRSIRFRPLPGTGREARDVAAIWGMRSEVRLLLGPDATEGALGRYGPGRSVIHIATHGFFLDGDARSVSALTSRGIGALSPALEKEPAASPCSGNPLLLSGLAFAGANDRAAASPNDEDGILTAEEVSAIDLTGVDWVVLSACDTGRGRIQAGEGVVGLRRAFQIAGARSVIMSLWAVDDESARQWMTALYEARIRGGMEAPDAVANADLSVLRWRRAHARSADPFYWAAFVAAGDWK